MRKLIALTVAGLVLSSALPALAQKTAKTLPPGQLIKVQNSAAVYYLDDEGKRHVFPNHRIFQSWYDGFGEVITIEDSEISQYPLGEPVPYKPAKRLIKIQSDPKVYAVDDGGILRWVKSEAAARALYGKNWNRFVDDIPASFFANYVMGEEIDGEEDFDADMDEEIAGVGATLKVGQTKVKVCHKRGKSGKQHTIYISQAALAAHLAHGDTEGECAVESPGDGEDGDEEEDETAPVISAVTVFDITASTASVSWVTDEEASYDFYYADSSAALTGGMADASAVSVSEYQTDHQVDVDTLLADTAYYYLIKVEDEAGNGAETAVDSFTTLSAAN